MTKIQVTGLRTGTVRLVEYRDEWPNTLKRERDRIGAVLKGNKLTAVIQHVGSTSIKEIHSKPIIDIAVGLARPSEIDVARVALVKKAGYDYVPAANQPGMVFLAKGQSNIRYFHVHLTVRNSLAWSRLVEVRDYLRRYRTAREYYDQVKLGLAKEYPDNRVEYARAKNPLLEVIVLKALLLLKRRRMHAAIQRTRERELKRIGGAIPVAAVFDPVTKLHASVLRNARPVNRTSRTTSPTGQTGRRRLG